MHEIVLGPLQLRHNERDGVSNMRRLDCLLNHLFRRLSKKTSKICVTDLYQGNPLVTGGFPSQKASDAEIFPLDDVIMTGLEICENNRSGIEHIGLGSSKISDICFSSNIHNYPVIMGLPCCLPRN